ncbi:sodium-dependent bicarbonate transport family permease [Candidatus Thioglobus sp.]|uniref:sodium-dependent bicarbonate transport family permease n=1 Tax=Candidatus Thioglobus sp. TaxID=2026721 RepID=UPI003D1327C4
MPGFGSLLIPAALFFALGVITRFVRPNLHFLEGIAKGLSLYLLMAIGLKGQRLVRYSMDTEMLINETL